MRANRHHRGLRTHEDGISVVIGAIMVVSILAVTTITYQTEHVPVHQKGRESEHAARLASQMADLRANLDRETAAPSGLAIANPLRLSAGSASFGVNRPSDSVSFTPGANTGLLTSPRLTIRATGSGMGAGASENWQSIGAGTTVSDVNQVQNLRLNLTAVNRDQVGKSIVVRISDANGFAGDFEVAVNNPPGNDYGVNYKVRNRAGEILYNQPDQYQQGAGFGFSPFWLNVLEPRFRFDTVVAAAQPPLTVSLVPGANPLTGLYAITYTQFATATLLGGSGSVLAPYTSPSFSSGTLTYRSNNIHFPQQTYVFENGGVILEQPDGAVFAIDPTLDADRITGIQSGITLNRPNGVVTNDLLLAQVTWAGGAGVVLTPPAGWTLVRTTTGGADLAQAIYWKRASDAEPGSYAWGLSSAVKATGSILAFNGIVTNANPIGASSENVGSGASIVAASVTPSQPNEFVVGFFSIATATTITTPAGMTPHATTTTSGPGVSTLVASEFALGTTPTGTRTATSASGGVNIANLVTLKAATALVQRTATTAATPTSGASSLSIPKHATVTSGDVMVASIATTSAATVTPPTGWTQIRRETNGNLALTTFWKTNTGEAGPYVFSLPSGTRAAGGIVAFAGVETAAPIDASAAQPGSGTTVTAPNVATTRQHAYVLAVFASLSNSNYASYTGGLAQAFSQPLGGSTPVSLAGATVVQAASGPGGSRTATSSVSAVNLGTSIAIRPATNFRAAFSGTTDTGAAVRVSLSLPTLTGQPQALTGDKTVAVETVSNAGTSFQAVCYEFSYTVSTKYPKAWGAFLRKELTAASLTEGTHFTVDDASPSQVTFRILGPNTDSSTDDVFLVLRQSNVRLAIRG